MIRFVDSFGHYNTQAALYTKWSFGSGSDPQMTGGRDNGPCVNGHGTGSNQLGRLLNFSSGQTLWITGVAAQGSTQTVLAGNAYGSAFTTANFTDSTNGGTMEWGMSGYSLTITGAGGMQVTVNAFYQDGGGAWHDRTQFVSSAFQYQSAPLSPSLWYYFEVKVFVDVAHGNQVSIEVRVNGTVVYTLAAVNFSGFAGVWPALHTFAPVLTGNYLSADFVCLDDTGAFNTSYLGDVRVVAQLPASDGHYQDWTPLTAGNHFSEVDATSPPGDASYVSSATPGNTDSYGFSTPPSSTQVFGVQVNLWARKSDAGGRTIEALARLSSTDALSSPQTLSTSYGDFMSVFETDPSGAAWTSASLALAEFGVKLSA